MDCRSHTWNEAPSMQMAPSFPRVSVLDGKIYVVEGDFNFDSSNLQVECFDPKTRKWEDVSSTGAKTRGTIVMISLAMEGNLYLYGLKKNVVYKPKENRWDEVGLGSDLLCCDLEYPCMIDNVLYISHFQSPRTLEWYDSEGRTGRAVKGLEKHGRLDRSFQFVNNGGKIAAFWEEDFGSDKKKIWCAEISLERRSKEEIFGKIEWCNDVLTVPKDCCYEQFIAAIV